MLPNKFDQYFRDKLLDHSTKVSPGTWKSIHAGLLRHKAFHVWKWYVAGPAVVVAALTGYLILAQINKPGKAHADAAAHTLTQPVTAPASTTTAPASTTAPANAAAPATTGTPASDNTTLVSTAAATASTPKTNSAPVADGTVHKLHTTSGTNTAIKSAAINARLTSNADTRHATNTRNTTNTHPATHTRLAIHTHTRREPRSRPETGLLATDAPSAEAANSEQNQASQQNQTSTQNQAFGQNQASTQNQPAVQNARSTNTHRPTGLMPPPTIVRPATRLAVTAKTPNPGSSKNLILPATPYQPNGRWRIDGFASPEYFSFKEFGFSYGAGARATIVLKQHFTITTGLQYLKVDVRARQKNDSLNSLFPGIFNNIQVPLLFGYTTGNRRFSATVNAGAIFSLYADAKGRLKDYGWPSHNGITSYLGFNFATRVGNRLSLFAEPYIKTWYPQKFQDLPPRLFSTGISIGLRFDLK
jgi:hypothetical protein